MIVLYKDDLVCVDERGEEADDQGAGSQVPGGEDLHGGFRLRCSQPRKPVLSFILLLVVCTSHSPL